MGLHGRNSIQLCTVPPVTVVHGRFYDAADASYARRLETVVEFILARMKITRIYREVGWFRLFSWISSRDDVYRRVKLFRTKNKNLSSFLYR